MGVPGCPELASVQLRLRRMTPGSVMSCMGWLCTCQVSVTRFLQRCNFSSSATPPPLACPHCWHQRIQISQQVPKAHGELQLSLGTHGPQAFRKARSVWQCRDRNTFQKECQNTWITCQKECLNTCKAQLTIPCALLFCHTASAISFHKLKAELHGSLGTHGPATFRELRKQLGTHGPEPYHELRKQLGMQTRTHARENVR